MATDTWASLAERLGRTKKETDYIFSPPDRESMPGYSRAAKVQYARGTARLNNGFMEFVLRLVGGRVAKAQVLNQTTGEHSRWDTTDFAIALDGQTLTPESFAPPVCRARQAQQVASLELTYRDDAVTVRVRYRISRNHHYVRKQVEVEAREAVVIRDVQLLELKGHEQAEFARHDGGAYFPIVFLRAKKGGLFVCAEGNCTFANAENGRVTLEQFPGISLEAGHSITFGPAVVGVYEKTGREYRNPYHEEGAALDRGERNWFLQYAIDTCPIRSPLPVLELSAREAADAAALEKCAILGLDHVGSVTSAEAMASAKERGIRTGAMILPGRPLVEEWSIVRKAGRPPASASAEPCLASPYVDWQISQYDRAAALHGFDDALLPDLVVAECESESHNHLPGKYALFPALQAHARWVDALRERYANIRGYGSYGSYAMTVAPALDGVPLLAEPHPLGLPDLRLLRMHADMARLYARRSYDFLVPAYRLLTSTGAQAHPAAETHFDSEGWRYAVLSALSLGMWNGVNYFPAEMPQQDRDFATYWFAWQKQHMKYMLRPQPLLNEPGMEGIDGVAHIWQDEGFVFLFNPTYETQRASLALELSERNRYWVAEMYPRRLVLSPEEGAYFERGSAIRVELAPKQASVLEIRKAKPSATVLRIMGVEVDGVRRHGADNLAQVRGQPGQTASVRLARGRAEPEDVEVAFPGEQTQRSITGWGAASCPLQEGLDEAWQSGEFEVWPLEDARGAFIEHAWLRAEFSLPEEIRTAFALQSGEASAFWPFEKRLVAVIRIEPPSVFDPIRTSGPLAGRPESHWGIGHKVGIGYSAERNLEFRVWVNGVQAAVQRDDWLVVPFADITDHVNFGQGNTVVIYCPALTSRHFKGLYLENLPERSATTTITVPIGRRPRAKAVRKRAVRRVGKKPARKAAGKAVKKPVGRPRKPAAKKAARPAPKKAPAKKKAATRKAAAKKARRR